MSNYIKTVETTIDNATPDNWEDVEIPAHTPPVVSPPPAPVEPQSTSGRSRAMGQVPGPITPGLAEMVTNISSFANTPAKDLVAATALYEMGGTPLTISQLAALKNDARDVSKVVRTYDKFIYDEPIPTPAFGVDPDEPKAIKDAFRAVEAVPVQVGKRRFTAIRHIIRVPQLVVEGSVKITSTSATGEVDVTNHPRLVPSSTFLPSPNFRGKFAVVSGDGTLYRTLLTYSSILKSRDPVYSPALLKEITAYLQKHYFGARGWGSIAKRLMETMKTYALRSVIQPTLLAKPGASNRGLANFGMYRMLLDRYFPLANVSGLRLHRPPSVIAQSTGQGEAPAAMRAALSNLDTPFMAARPLLRITPGSAGGFVMDQAMSMKDPRGSSYLLLPGVTDPKERKSHHSAYWAQELGLADQLMADISRVIQNSDGGSLDFTNLFSKWSFARLAKVVPKFEVYGNDKVNRAIFATTFFAQIPLHFLLRASLDSAPVGMFPLTIGSNAGHEVEETPQSCVLKGFTPLKGGMARYIRTIDSSSQGLKPNHISVAVYSDNLYILHRSQRGVGKPPMITVLSADASKMEGSHTDYSAAYMVQRFLSNAGMKNADSLQLYKRVMASYAKSIKDGVPVPSEFLLQTPQTKVFLGKEIRVREEATRGRKKKESKSKKDARKTTRRKDQRDDKDSAKFAIHDVVDEGAVISGGVRSDDDDDEESLALSKRARRMLERAEEDGDEWLTLEEEELEIEKAVKADPVLQAPAPPLMSTMSPEYTAYFTHVLPYLSSTVGVIQDYQFRIPFLASGVASTFAQNTETMCLAACPLMASPFLPSEEAGESGASLAEPGSLDPVAIGDGTKITAFTPKPGVKPKLPKRVDEHFANNGVQLRVESIISFPAELRLADSLHPLPVDLLGFDAFPIRGGSRTYWFSRLQRNRLIGGIVFLKNMGGSKLSPIETVRNHIFRLATIKGLYAIGGFAYPDLRAFLTYYITTMGLDPIQTNLAAPGLLNALAHDAYSKLPLNDLDEADAVVANLQSVLDLTPSVPSLSAIARIHLSEEDYLEFMGDQAEDLDAIRADLAVGGQPSDSIPDILRGLGRFINPPGQGREDVTNLLTAVFGREIVEIAKPKLVGDQLASQLPSFDPSKPLGSKVSDKLYDDLVTQYYGVTMTIAKDLFEGEKPITLEEELPGLTPDPADLPPAVRRAVAERKLAPALVKIMDKRLPSELSQLPFAAKLSAARRSMNQTQGLSRLSAPRVGRIVYSQTLQEKVNKQTKEEEIELDLLSEY